MTPVPDDTRLFDRILGEWPAVLAVFVLAAGHIYLVVVAGEEFTLLGIPLLLAIAVFLLGEGVRRLRSAN